MLSQNIDSGNSSKCSKVSLESKEEKHKKDAENLCDAIFTLIPEVQRLKELFLCWSLLSSQERDELDRQVLSNFTQERMSLYKPLKEALYRWELLQDTQGAPGCEPGTVSFSCDPQLEEEITNIIYTLEVLLKKLRACGSKSKNVAIINIEMCKDVGALMSNDRRSRQPGKSLSKSRAVPAHSVQSYSQLLMANNEFSVELSGYNTD